jgi:hypothetical protein
MMRVLLEQICETCGLQLDKPFQKIFEVQGLISLSIPMAGQWCFLSFLGGAATAALISALLRKYLRKRCARKSEKKLFGQGYLRSLGDVEAEAADALPDYVFEYFQYAADGGAQEQQNQAFDDVNLIPRVLCDVSKISLDVEVTRCNPHR